MTAKIYKPTKTAMQSGLVNTKYWLLEYIAKDTRSIDDLMGWTSNKDPKSQVKLKFKSKQEAIKYAESKKLSYIVINPQKSNLKLQSYSDNFI